MKSTESPRPSAAKYAWQSFQHYVSERFMKRNADYIRYSVDIRRSYDTDCVVFRVILLSS